MLPDGEGADLREQIQVSTGKSGKGYEKGFCSNKSNGMSKSHSKEKVKDKDEVRFCFLSLLLVGLLQSVSDSHGLGVPIH